MANKEETTESEPSTDPNIGNVTCTEFTWRGLFMQGPFTAELFDRVHGMKTREEDIFMASYPRTGANWTKNIILGLIDGVESLKGEGGRVLFQRFPYIDRLGSGFAIAESKEGQRRLMTHLPCHLAPTEIISNKRKVVLVLRDVHATAWSLYNFYQTHDVLQQFKHGSWNEFFEFFMQGKVSYGSWWSWTKGWLDYYQAENKRCEESGQKCHVCLIFYENLQRNFNSEVEKLINFMSFLELPHLYESKTMQEELAKECSIKIMKSRYENAPNSEKDFIRKGMPEEWKLHFTDEQSKMLKNKTKEELRMFKDLLVNWESLQD